MRSRFTTFGNFSHQTDIRCSNILRAKRLTTIMIRFPKPNPQPYIDHDYTELELSKKKSGECQTLELAKSGCSLQASSLGLAVFLQCWSYVCACIYACMQASMHPCMHVYLYTQKCIYGIIYLFVDMDRVFWKLVVDRELHA